MNQDQRGHEQYGRNGRGRENRGQTNRQRSQPNRTPRVEISAARLVAYDVLRDVEDRDAYANLALPSRIRDAQLDGRDAGLATELSAGALRGRGRYDRIIELAAARDISDIDSRTRNVLRLGAHQLLGMRTAAHAAVNESVELQRRVANSNAAGFVNGVLRTIGRSTNEEWDERITEAARNDDEALAARTSHPTWIVRALRDALRAEGRVDELTDLLNADNTPPRVNLAVLPGAGIDLDSDEYACEAAFDRDAGADTELEPSTVHDPARDAGTHPAPVAVGPSPIGLELQSGDPARAIASIGAPDGFVRVQDQGSQLAALALTRVRAQVSGERWLDLCAGPGGKTAVLGAEALEGLATVRANELSEHRAELVVRSIVAVDSVVEVVSYDGREAEAFGGHGEEFDRILLDAPCSGLGALRRRPEARWRKQPSDLPALTALQGELLTAAAEHLAPGGVLAYVTCSPHLAETRVAVDRLLKRRPELRELDAKAAVREIARVPIDLPGLSLSAQLWPHRHGTDAMFIALIERR